MKINIEELFHLRDNDFEFHLENPLTIMYGFNGIGKSTVGKALCGLPIECKKVNISDSINKSACEYVDCSERLSPIEISRYIDKAEKFINETCGLMYKNVRIDTQGIQINSIYEGDNFLMEDLSTGEII